VDELTGFLGKHMPRLQQHIDAIAPHYRVAPEFLNYVEQVLDDWAEVGIDARRSDYRPGERVFWYSLYLMEELAELRPSAHADPYVGMMRDNLAELRRHLAKRAELPARFDVCRPGALELAIDDELDPDDIDFDSCEPPVRH
jgi:hypothetical protein